MVRSALQVDRGGLNLFVAEPEGDDGGVDAGVEELHRGGVSQGVRGDPFVAKGGAVGCRGGHVFGDEFLDGVAGELAAPTRGEQRGVGLAGLAGEPGVQGVDALFGQGGDPFLAALAVAADVGADTKADVVAVQGGQLGDS